MHRVLSELSDALRVSCEDPLTIGLGALAVVGFGVLAAWMPARRAIRSEPATALRCE